MDYIYAYDIRIFEEQKLNDSQVEVNRCGFIYANSYSDAVLQLEHYFDERYIVDVRIFRYEGPLMVSRSTWCKVIDELEEQ